MVGVSEGIWTMPLFETRVSYVPCPHSLVRCHGMDMTSGQASEAVCFGTFQPLTLNFNLPAPTSCWGDGWAPPHLVLGLFYFLSALQQTFDSCLSNE